MRKGRQTIAVEDVDRVFDGQCIERLADNFLPADADRQRFAGGIREAARIYARDAREPTVNEFHDEIAALYRAADHRQFDRLASLIDRLSLKARNLLDRRGKRLGLALPSIEIMRGTEAEEACVAVARLAYIGGRDVKGRMRPTGKRSRDVWRPLLLASERQRHLSKRDAERYFVLMLQAAWRDAVNELPSLAVNRARPSRFAKLARECFKLVGAVHADVFNLINIVSLQRRELNNLSAIKTRTS